jgi:hypothetical protein
MSKKSIRIGAAFVLICVLVGGIGARALLERTIYYLAGGEVGKCKFWAIHMGSFNCKRFTYFSVDDGSPAEGNFNLSLLSSGYVEGNGYAETGRINCMGYLHIGNGTSVKKIVLDSIDYVYENGRKVRMLNGNSGNLLIDIEGTKASPRQLELRKYELVNMYDEEVLKDTQEFPITAFAFSEEGITRAKQELASR